MLGQYRARSGNRSEAKALLDELRQRSDQEYVPSVTMSWIAMALGETDRAIDWLEQEHRDRGVSLFSAAVGIWFDEVRDTPRLQALLRRMNFPETTSPSDLPPAAVPIIKRARSSCVARQLVPA